MNLFSYGRIFLFFLLAISLIVPASADEKIPLVKTKLIVPERFRSGPFAKERYLNAPEGFNISVFAAGLERPRFMAVGPDGFLYVSLITEGKIVVLPDKNKDGIADDVIIFADRLKQPHGLAFDGKDLIVAENDKLRLLRDTDSDLRADTKKILTEDMPGGGVHFTRTVVVGKDGFYYVSAGSSCNVCSKDDKRRAAVRKFPPEGGKGELFAIGLRNTVGLAVHPISGELWGVDNGRDMLGDDIPPEELNLIVDDGDYGWPYCYGDKIPDPEYGTEARCSKTKEPVVKMQAHSAPLGIAFGEGLSFPEKFKDMLYIGFHGSWNRTIPTGYKLVAVPFKEGRPTGPAVDIITGWLTEGGAWGRPVAPIVGRDGALYLTDDQAGAVYRIMAK